MDFIGVTWYTPFVIFITLSFIFVCIYCLCIVWHLFCRLGGSWYVDCNDYGEFEVMSIANIFKWAGTVVTLLGALATALMIDPLNIWLLNLGAVLFLIWGYLIRDRAMMTVNAGLLSIYIVGLYIRV